MNRVQNKSARLGQIERLLLVHPKGLRKAEIARRCGIHRSTVGRNLTDLGEGEVPLWEDDEGYVGIDREAYLTHIRLNIHECMAMFLAARLLARYSDKPNPYAIEALQKLGLALERSAPRIGRHIVQTSEALHTDLTSERSGYMEVLETLTQAWSQFKLERIQRAELTEECYEIPEDFDPAELLKSAWGIWYGEEALTEVQLRFSPRAAQRLKESTWHSSERVEDTEDGGCIWTGYVAEVQEMVPWIRGWGSDCEVLAPGELRNMMIGEARRLARVYGWAVHREEKPARGKGIHEKHHFFNDFFGE